MNKQNAEIAGKLTSSGSVYHIKLPKKLNAWLNKYSNVKFEQPCLCLIFNSKKMKNKISLSSMVAIGLVIVSCSTDTDGINTSSQKQNDGLNLKIADSIIKTPTTTYTIDDGTLPPIKP